MGNQTVACAICSRPVSLEAAKTDDHGKPVHEDCYADKMKRELEQAPPARKA